MEASHLAVVPLIVVLAVPPDVLLIDDVVANSSAMAGDEATVGNKTTATVKAVAVDGVDILRGRGWGMPP